MTDIISRADAVKTVIKMCSPICEWQDGTQQYPDCVVAEIKALPSADAVREEYEETDGVVKIKKQSAKEVGEIKHIVVCSPNYTRYFYNDSMPIQYKGGDTE